MKGRRLGPLIIFGLNILFADIWQVLVNSDCKDAISQMPVVLLPLHFDRDTANRGPSCQRSVVLRPFCTSDFMTGVPAIPGRQIPVHVSAF